MTQGGMNTQATTAVRIPLTRPIWDQNKAAPEEFLPTVIVIFCPDASGKS